MSNKLRKMEITSDPTLIRHFKGHTNLINQLAFCPTAKQIASASNDHSVMIWDFEQAARCFKFTAHTDAVNSVAWCPKKELIASASSDKMVQLWVPKMTGCPEGFRAHTAAVRSVDFNFDGQKITTCSDDKSVKLWSTTRKKFITSFTGHTNWVRRAKFSPSGKLIASCGDDKSVRVFDVSSGECIYSFSDEKGEGREIAWHPDNSIVAVALSRSNRIKVFDYKAKKLVQLYHVHSENVNSIAFHPSGNYLLTGSDDGTMKILDLLEGRPIYTLTGHEGQVTAIAFSKGDDHFASAGSDLQLMIWRSNLEQQSIDSNETGIGLLSSKSHFSSHLGNHDGALMQDDLSVLIDVKKENSYSEACQMAEVNLLQPSSNDSSTESAEDLNDEILNIGELQNKFNSSIAELERHIDTISEILIDVVNRIEVLEEK